VSTFLLATTTGTAGAGDTVLSSLLVCLLLAAAVLTIAGHWQILTKAQEPGWAILVPIYGTVKLLQISGRSGWWTLLLFVPYVGVITSIVLCVSLARVFGKGVGFGIGLLFLPFVFVPILGFGSAEYIGPVQTREQPAPAAY
jgi:hypothetical protein